MATRESLCDLLWGEWDLDQARTSLRQALWFLRRKVGLVLAEPAANTITLPPIDVDALAFTAAVERGDLERALGIYAGDFFEGFASPGAAEFERWASLERRRLRSHYIHTAESLARRLLDSGKPIEAGRVARRLRVMDPHGETGWRLSLEALVSAGDSIGARTEADHFEEWLRVEERDPEPASLSVLRTARQSTIVKPPDAGQPDLRAELVGREYEFALLQSLWVEARTKGARRVHIVAPGGYGKTRLVADFCARLRSARANTASLRAHPGEQYVPYAFAATVASALAALPGAAGISGASASALLALDPTLSSRFMGHADPSSGAEALRRRGLALSELVAAVADDSPLAITLDDLHWCDASSAQIIATLSSRLHTERVLLVTTARPRHAVPPLHDDTASVWLPALTAAHVEQLLASMAQLPDTPWAAALPELLAESAKGSPLLVQEAIRVCLDRGLLTRANGRWSCTDFDAIAPALALGVLIGRRVSGLAESERFMLLLLALSGRPLPPALVCDAGSMGRPLGDHAMQRLEARGLALSTGATWGIAHDDIAEAALDASSDSERHAAHFALGRTMAAHEDVAWRRRAVEHLAAADDAAAVAETVMTVISRTHRTRDALDTELSALLGRLATPLLVADVRKALPFWTRHPGWRRPAMALAAGVVALAGGVGAWRMAERAPAPPAELVIGTPIAAGAYAVRHLVIDTARWDATRALTLPPQTAVERWAAFPARGWRAAISAADGRWVREQVYADTGGVDVEVLDSKGERMRLTTTRGDNRPYGFSPDGASVLIMTSRWSDAGHNNLAVIDAHNGALRARLTRAQHVNDGGAAWSPAGLRIAFLRLDLLTGGRALCWVLADGNRERCGGIQGWRSTDINGWTSGGKLLVTADSANATRWKVFVVDPDTFDAVPTDIPATTPIILDPTGRWLLLPERQASEWIVHISPLDRIDRARAIEHFPDSASGFATWWPVARERRYVDRVIVSRPRGPFVTGVPYVLRARGITPDGDTLPVAPALAEWSSDNVARATVDSDGVFIAHDTGTVVIHASAGGWRGVADTILVEPRATTLALDERWTPDFTTRWQSFGEPLPMVVPSPQGSAFLNNGDGNFFSGAYLRKAIRSVQGLAVEAEFTTPVTRSQWQVMFMFLDPLSAYDSVSAWDHHTGYIPMIEAQHTACAFGYPQGEGAHAIEAANGIGRLRDVPVNPPLRLFDGRPYRVRLQLLPDGRCGVAINGMAVYAWDASGLADDQWRVTLEGSSAGSPMLVHHLRVWQGVPDDVDWSALRRQGDSWRLVRGNPR